MRDFTELTHLDTEALRALLETGAAPERVRAAWALALRLGGSLRPELSQAARTEPEAGVRRHLVVLIAGYQERAVLAALATEDPDDEVRATACQYLAMLGRAEEVATWRLLHGRLESERSAGVLRACITYLPPHTPDFLRAAVATHVGAESLEVRRVAADKLLEWAGLAGEGVPGALVPRLVREEDVELRSELVRRGQALDGGRSLLKILAEEELPRETIGYVLENFTRRERRFGWEWLHPFTLREWPEVDDSLTELLDPHAPVEASTWLLTVALRFWRDREQDYDSNIAHAAYGALGALTSRLESKPDGMLDEQGLTLARELLSLLEEHRREVLASHLDWCMGSAHDACFLDEWEFESALIALGNALGTKLPSPPLSY